MAAQSLRLLLEAVSAAPGSKKLTGEIKSADILLKSDALARLDARHPGVFAIVLFNDKLDLPIARYLASDSMATDTGPNILVLYEGTPKSRVMRTREATSDGLKSIKLENPAVAFARKLFPHSHLMLPGIVIVERLGASDDAVFVCLDASSTTAVHRIRSVWKFISEEWNARSPQRPFTQSLGVRLAKEGIPYFRSEGVSVREQLITLLRALWEIRRDLLALVPVVGKAFAKKKSDDLDV